jgi:AcrR family transcriptional regulator
MGGRRRQCASRYLRVRRALVQRLRKRKRRLTRHLIADAATAMFASRGFDGVKVSEIADRVNVSMKTLYNYFPTKESMVLDADELIEGLATALRDGRRGHR